MLLPGLAIPCSFAAAPTKRPLELDVIEDVCRSCTLILRFRFLETGDTVSLRKLLPGASCEGVRERSSSRSRRRPTLPGLEASKENRVAVESNDGRWNAWSGSGSVCGLWDGISGDGEESTSPETDPDDRPRSIELETLPPLPELLPWFEFGRVRESKELPRRISKDGRPRPIPMSFAFEDVNDAEVAAETATGGRRESKEPRPRLMGVRERAWPAACG